MARADRAWLFGDSWHQNRTLSWKRKDGYAYGMYPRHAESAKRFGALLAQHAQRKKDEKSLREISAEVGCGSGLLSRIAKGTRRLPVRYLEPIADALGLAGEQRSEFFRLGLQAFLGDDYATIVRLVEKRKKS